MTDLVIVRDDDCDCPPWLRWRIEARWYQGGSVKINILTHTITKLGARWKRRRLSRQYGVLV